CLPRDRVADRYNSRAGRYEVNIVSRESVHNAMLDVKRARTLERDPACSALRVDIQVPKNDHIGRTGADRDPVTREDTDPGMHAERRNDRHRVGNRDWAIAR